MNTRKEIKNNLSKIKRGNYNRTKSYKQKLLKQIDENINKRGQSIAENKGLIIRYQSAKPQQLTQMQQAMEDAV